MIHSFDKKNMKKNYDMISLIPVKDGEVISNNTVNYLDFLSSSSNIMNGFDGGFTFNFPFLICSISS